MPNAKAPNAPWVDVWLSPQQIVMPGLREAKLRPDDMNNALPLGMDVVERDAEIFAVLGQRRHLLLRDLGPPPAGRGSWSARCGPLWRLLSRARRTVRPVSRKAFKRPAAKSLHELNAGQYTAAPAARLLRGQRARPRFFSNIVRGMIFSPE